MASQTTKTEKTEPTTSEKLQEEAEGSQYLHLLRPVEKVTAPERLRFMARIAPIQESLGNLGDDEGILAMPTEALDQLADFTEYVADRFSVDPAAHEKIVRLDLTEYLDLVLTYMSQLGESLGSSN